MKMNALLMVVIVTLASCATKLTEKTAEEIIVARSDERSSRPDWATEEFVTLKNGGDFYSIGTSTILAEQKIDAGFKIAEGIAKGNISKLISQKLEYTLQHADEGMLESSPIIRFMNSEVSKIESSGITVKNRYWEKYVTVDNSNTRRAYYRIFVRVAISEGILNQALAEALVKGKREGKFSAEFSDKVKKNWDKLGADL